MVGMVVAQDRVHRAQELVTPSPGSIAWCPGARPGRQRAAGPRAASRCGRIRLRSLVAFNSLLGIGAGRNRGENADTCRSLGGARFTARPRPWGPGTLRGRGREAPGQFRLRGKLRHPSLTVATTATLPLFSIPRLGEALDGLMRYRSALEGGLRP